MVNEKVFQFSCDILWGYRTEIDLDDCDTLDDIVVLAVASLSSFLEAHNLLVLQEKIQQINYHIHDYTIEQLKQQQSNAHDNVHGYICGHNGH
jgi:hypothetical protein